MISDNSVTLHIGPHQDGRCDLVITPRGNGQGSISLDRTISSSLLLALCSDRRADEDDSLPALLTTSDRQPTPLGGRRGWAGDIFQENGQRFGSKLWLLERAKRNEATRLSAMDYATDSVSDIGTYHNQELTVSAHWSDDRRSELVVQVKGDQTTVTQKVKTA
ncbi:hypothetical protein GT348_07295 [Aristophania vespae]|uniref:Uncharacterized protein n=1 Tax=Aristophania vespae TaxID=2697033 RepID=A0A6P1NGN9_9PROT|nr:phage GP46 family protein [Aristophania vespae]QHI96067.1 hypothetical protein GT348_07295 [Aristophania vespae]UMM63833.1 hypothetical protein DM15PD_08100 [Aristophania vespae]